MKRIILGVIVIILCIAAGGVYFTMKNQDEIVNQIENSYMEKGLIRDYDKVESMHLAESIGQYMTYLVEINDEKRFEEQVKVLENNFFVNESDNLFIKWELNNTTSTNAIVDDFRISNALHLAAKVFEKQKYKEIATKIDDSVKKNMIRSNVLIDFYDWKFQEKAKTLHINYLDSQSVKRLGQFDEMKKILLESKRSGPFFSEIYFPDKQIYQFTNDAEVNMIDQVLIAIAYKELTGRKDKSFDQFISNELLKGKIYTRYDLKTGAPKSNDESSTVYAMLLSYLDGDLKNKTEQRLKTIDLTNAKTTHVFDYLNAAIESNR
ncbi:glycoside transferase [Exiguobacterium sp. ERU656]|uniref:glycoside transferase n=1 Tax=Exiguobacterium sp. ERU656 TaxID=2751217 RepID=UPI001BE57EC8|nr:glycoside transferase [Exiguobacterium sp. ERU656]